MQEFMQRRWRLRRARMKRVSVSMAEAVEFVDQQLIEAAEAGILQEPVCREIMQRGLPSSKSAACRIGLQATLQARAHAGIHAAPFTRAAQAASAPSLFFECGISPDSGLGLISQRHGSNS